MKAPLRALGWLALLFPSAASAHHGVAAVGVAGPEGPGAALETTSALPLPVSMGFAFAKSEFVSFQHRAVAEPNNRDLSSFNMVALGFGIRPWLSAYVFQPFNMKSQDGVGRNVGPGDTNLMLTLGFKYDEGFRLVPEKESLDELTDWHFALWAACTLPFGPTEHTDDNGQPFAPDMQTGFGAPSPALGLAVLKQIAPAFTWMAEVNQQRFFAHTYSFTRYQFGTETRLNTALVYRIFGHNHTRLDGIAELSGLNIQRDREDNESESLAPLSASGGSLLYAGVGVRLMAGSFSAAMGLRRAVLKHLNEGEVQQGSEGLENLRATLSLSYSRRF